MTTETTQTERRYGKITDEGIAQLRAKIGRERPITIPYNRWASEDGIVHFCRGIGEMNPLYLDEDYARTTRWGGIVAPPAFLYSVHWGSWDMRRGHGLPGVHGLHARDRWDFRRPIRAGERIYGIRTLHSLEEKEGKFAGRQVLQTYAIRYQNEAGEDLGTCYMSSMRTDRDEARSRGKYKDVKLGHYAPDELAEIEAAYDAEIIRGQATRYWEDVVVGEDVQPVMWGPLTSVDCIAWIMGTGSPHVRAGKYWLEYRRRTPAVGIMNPETGVPEPVERVHWDNYMAREAGMPAAYDYGSHRGAIASRLPTNWMGDEGFLKVLDVFYRGINYLGDTLWIKGRVKDKFVDGANSFVEITIEGVNQRGETIMPGRAVVALPSRERGPVVTPVELSRE